MTADLSHYTLRIPFVGRSGSLTTYSVAPADRDQASNFQPDAHRPTAAARAATSADSDGSGRMWIRRPAMIASGRKSGWFCCLAGDRRQNNSKWREDTRCTAIGPASNGRCVASLPEAAMARHCHSPCLIWSCGLHEGNWGCNQDFCARTRPYGRRQHQCYGQQQQGQQTGHDLHVDRIAGKPS